MLSVCQALCEGLNVFGLSESSWPPQEEALFLPSFYRKGKPRPREVRQPAWGHTVNPARRESSNFGSLLLESGCFESMKPYPGGPDGWWWWVPKACAGCWARALRECGQMSAFPMKKTKQKNSLPQIFYQVPTLCLALWLGPVKKKLEKVSILSLQLISLLCLITCALFEVVMVLTGHVLGLGWHHLAEAFPGRICPVLINGSVNSHACISSGCYTLGWAGLRVDVRLRSLKWVWSFFFFKLFFPNYIRVA